MIITRFPMLDDRGWWLANSHRTDAAIAAQLGCHPATVCRRRPIEGRARLSDATEVELIARVTDERRAEQAALGPAIIATRVRAVAEAYRACDPLGLEDAILSAATGLCLWHAQLVRRRTTSA
ncbi:MAG: hypothetical protein ACRDLV_01685 [Solirubrobacteraceae bacterium]